MNFNFQKTETRRLSPVAILSENGYLDLINGPKDHSWCVGSRCQKRISTFTALIAANRSYDIYLSSTAPKQLRFRIVNADDSFNVRLSMYYFSSQRIDLYVNNTFTDPSNAEYKNGDMVLKETTKANRNSFMPTPQSKVGANFFDKPYGQMFFTAGGHSVIDLKISPVLFVRFGFPAITPDDFFQSANLVGNIAGLLGVPASKIRRVNIVRESRRYSFNGTKFSLSSFLIYRVAFIAQTF